MFKKRNTKEQAPRRARPPQTGQGSSKVFSYHSMRRPADIEDDENATGRNSREEEVAKKGRNLLIKRLSALLVFGVMLGLVFVNSQLSPASTGIVLKGRPEQRLFLQDPSVYKAAAEKIMGQKIQDRTKLTFNKASFNSSMKRQFPEISSANAALPLFGSAMRVYIEPSSAALVLTSNNKSYVVDISGKVLANNTANASHDLPLVTDQSSITAAVGKQILPSDDVRSILLIFTQLKEKSIVVESMTLPKVAERLEVRIQGKPYYVKFNLHDAVLQQIGAYVAVQRKLDREGTTPSQYVDVRVADRAYYR